MRLLTIFLLCVVATWSKQFQQIPVEIEKNIAPRIIGGEVARSGQFPFMAALNVQTEDSSFFCGGALITNQWLLTSARCVSGATTVTVRLGSNKIEGDDPNRVTLATSHVVPHPEYNADTLDNDVGLIKLRLPVELSDYIQPVRLASTNLPQSAVPTALGWGQTSDEDAGLAPDLKFVPLAVVSNTECRLIFGNQVTDNMVCLDGNFNEGTCYGDSGSPLVVTLIGGQFLQHVGISAFFSGNGCESTDPSGYTRTYSYADWIRNETLNG